MSSLDAAYDRITGIYPPVAEGGGGQQITVDVRDFGAVGDGVTNDTAAIQAAIDASSGGEVFLPSGVFLTGTLTLRNGSWLVGTGYSINSILKANGNLTGGIITAANPFCGIRRIRLDGNEGAFTSDGLVLTSEHSWSFTVEFCAFVNISGNAVRVVDVNQLEITDCYFTGGSSGQLMLDGADNCRIVRNVFQADSAASKPDYVLRFLVSGASKTAHSALVEGNWFEYSDAFPMGINVIEVDALNVTIFRNHFNISQALNAFNTVFSIQSNSNVTIILNNNVQDFSGGSKILIADAGAKSISIKDNRGSFTPANWTNNSSESFVISTFSESTNSIHHYSDKTDFKTDNGQAGISLQPNNNGRIELGTTTRYIGGNGADTELRSNSRLFLRAAGGHVQVGNATGAGSFTDGGLSIAGLYLYKDLNGDLRTSVGAPADSTDGELVATPAPAYGSVFMELNGLLTLIGGAGSYVKVLGTTTDDGNFNTTLSSNRITHDKAESSRYQITANLSISTAIADKNIAVKIAKNGVVIGGRVPTTTTAINVPVQLSISASATLAQNDYIEVFITNLTDTTGVWVRDMYFTASSGSIGN